MNICFSCVYYIRMLPHKRSRGSILYAGYTMKKMYQHALIGVICISEVIDISPGNLDSSLCFLQPSVSHDVLCVCACFVAQSCATLCDPMDCDPPGSSVHGILQARILEWVAISFSRGSSPPKDEPRSPALQADSLPSEPQGKPRLLKYEGQ